MPAMLNSTSSITKAYQALRWFKPAKSAMFSHSLPSRLTTISTPKPAKLIRIYATA